MRILSAEWFFSHDISNELQWKGDIECYDKVMGQYPGYHKIWWYNLVLTFNQKTKGHFKR
jgi:hypothetical protein